MTIKELEERLKERGIVLTPRMAEQLDCYAVFLKEYNEKVNLTAITDYDEIIDKHFYDSLLAADGNMSGTLVDVGTGAGFPGVVLKIVFPDLHVILLEPLLKRCVFLELLIEKLELQGIEVVRVRGEEYSLAHREEYDYVTARAVTGMNKLIEICGAMVRMNGYFIAMRGKDGVTELEEASKAITAMGFEQKALREEELGGHEQRVIAYLQKIRKTPLKYPRKYNIMKKEPL
ncbi:MAG: 16S rRNA (guanine(527)-N(7))-methyltransferase RsmG [Erysipelotrichaceae bacterium]|nr:16S rRNA (guanine(527)-N(7))-methyltransferase RsmG [Erysipelotrichaceae bacterium]